MDCALCVMAVCKKSYEFLVSVNDEPLIDIEQVNEHLYEHVAAMHEAMVQLTSLDCDTLDQHCQSNVFVLLVFGMFLHIWFVLSGLL